MQLFSKVKKKMKEGGLSYTLRIILSRSAENVWLWISRCIFFACKSENILAIESHNDFDCNGGAFYDYLIENHINDHWKIVWLTRNDIYQGLPYNVYAFNYWRPSFPKEYLLNKAKYLFCDDKFIKKRRKKQIEIYCTHGGIGFKNTAGRIIVPEYVDYILSSSEMYDPFACRHYTVPYPNNKMLHFGFPANDILFKDIEDEYKKISSNKFKKKILWMPTFRMKNERRNDSNIVLPLGIPLFMSMMELEIFNDFLRETNCLLVIKLHPMQVEETYKHLKSLSNFVVLNGTKTKELGMDGYRLMRSSDAFISDYSSAAYSFLLLNRPMAFVLSDLKDYKIGLSVENYEDYMPGPKINTVSDLENFIQDIINGTDKYQNERIRLINELYTYVDGDASRRLAEYLNIF